jgi:hypothetical protein
MRWLFNRGSEAEDAAQLAAGDLDGSPELTEWPEDEAASAAPALMRQSTGAPLSLPALQTCSMLDFL